MFLNRIIKYRNVILLVIGILLIIISICLISYDKIELLKSNVFDEVELEKYRENNKDNGYTNIDNNGNHDNNNDYENIDDIETDEIEDDTVEITKEEKKKIEKEYIGYLEIDKINLKQGLVSKNSYYNNVSRNIQILKASDYPDKDKGNTILASHSGNSSISYFKNLYKLIKGDTAKIYYKNYIYVYKIVDIYRVPKTGSVRINRDNSKTCLTLITCTKDSKTEQTVYILELIEKEMD